MIFLDLTCGRTDYFGLQIDIRTMIIFRKEEELDRKKNKVRSVGLLEYLSEE